MAVARLGGSLTPLDAFDWVAGDPHAVAETRVRPTWTLDVMPDATVLPRLTRELVLRDGPLLRPVAPFLELWALTGDGPAQNWQPRPVSPELLAANGSSLADLTFTVTAMNLKAARRTGNPALGFGTFPAVQLRGDDHRPAPLLGTSPPGAAPAMIPPGRSIPLGQLPHPVGQPWSDMLRLDTIRIRFTPARGRFYRPPGAATVIPPAVVPARAFLDPDAGWLGASPGNRVIPGDTVDVQGDDTSLGVVDDTCDARIIVELALAGRPTPPPARSWSCAWTTMPALPGPARRSSLLAEIELAAAATVQRERDGALLTTEQELIECSGYGAPRRHSDPHIGSEVNALARAKADVTLQDPVGLYIDALSTAGWTTPDGADPHDFWRITRGANGFAVRAVYEVRGGRLPRRRHHDPGPLDPVRRPDRRAHHHAPDWPRAPDRPVERRTSRMSHRPRRRTGSTGGLSVSQRATEHPPITGSPDRACAWRIYRALLVLIDVLAGHAEGEYLTQSRWRTCPMPSPVPLRSWRRRSGCA